MAIKKDEHKRPTSWQKFIVIRLKEVHSSDELALMLRDLYKRYRVDQRDVNNFLIHLVSQIESAKANLPTA